MGAGEGRGGAGVGLESHPRARRRAGRELGAHGGGAPRPEPICSSTAPPWSCPGGGAGPQGPSDALEPSATGHPALNQLQLTFDQVGRYPYVVDLAYSPGGTALLAAARAHGVHAVDGLDVLAAQGALSLELWTGRRAPLELMRRAAGRRQQPAALEPGSPGYPWLSPRSRRPRRAGDRPRRRATDEEREPVVAVRRERRGRPSEDAGTTSTAAAGKPARARGRHPAASRRARGAGRRFLTDVIVELGLASRDGRRRSARGGAQLGDDARAPAARERHADPGRPRPGAGRALRPRAPRPDLVHGGHDGRQPRQHPGRQALSGDPGRLRRRAHAAGGDGGPLERARDRRHRDHDRLRRPRRGRAPGRHRGADLAPEPPRGRRRRRQARGGSRERRRRRRGRRAARRAPRTRPSSSSSTGSWPRRSSGGPRISTSRPRTARLRVRFRIDGVLQDITTVPRKMAGGVVSRIKIMAELEHRRAAHAPGRPRGARRSTANTSTCAW